MRLKEYVCITDEGTIKESGDLSAVLKYGKAHNLIIARIQVIRYPVPDRMTVPTMQDGLYNELMLAVEKLNAQAETIAADLDKKEHGGK